MYIPSRELLFLEGKNVITGGGILLTINMYVIYVPFHAFFFQKFGT